MRWSRRTHTSLVSLLGKCHPVGEKEDECGTFTRYEGSLRFRYGAYWPSLFALNIFTIKLAGGPSIF
jgi:hypothetical protein